MQCTRLPHTLAASQLCTSLHSWFHYSGFYTLSLQLPFSFISSSVFFFFIFFFFYLFFFCFAPSRLIRTLRFARGLKKSACYPLGFRFFFQNTTTFEIEVGFFSTSKSFWNFSTKYSELSFYKLIMSEVSRNLRNIFFTKYPPFWNLKLDFFPLKKVFEIFRRNRVNFIMSEVSRNLRNIFFHKIPPILKLEVGFFSSKKKFFADFPKCGTFIPSKLHFCKFS